LRHKTEIGHRKKLVKTLKCYVLRVFGPPWRAPHQASRAAAL
jgi:hypothetical protein